LSRVLRAPARQGAVMKKLSLLICLLCAGCSALMQSQSLVRPPELSFVDAAPHSFTLTGCRVDVRLQAKNPNSFAINLETMDVVLYINNRKTVNTAFNNISLKANGTSPLNTTVTVPYASSGLALMGALQSGSGLNYKVVGVAHYKTPLGTIQFPLTLYKN
jgi:hypothetical protein